MENYNSNFQFYENSVPSGVNTLPDECQDQDPEFDLVIDDLLRKTELFECLLWLDSLPLPSGEDLTVLSSRPEQVHDQNLVTNGPGDRDEVAAPDPEVTVSQANCDGKEDVGMEFSSGVAEPVNAIPTRNTSANTRSLAERERRLGINQRLNTLIQMIPYSRKGDKSSTLDQILQYIWDMKTVQFHMLSKYGMDLIQYHYYKCTMGAAFMLPPPYPPPVVIFRADPDLAAALARRHRIRTLEEYYWLVTFYMQLQIQFQPPNPYNPNQQL